jgi:hypothetical protein
MNKRQLEKEDELKEKIKKEMKEFNTKDFFFGFY